MRVGVAKSIITPENGMWLAGYAHRDHPSEGKLCDLFVKALAIEDSTGSVFVLVTSDLLGLTKSVAKEISSRVQKDLGIPRERLMLTSSHTHSGPIIRDAMIEMYELSDDQKQMVEDYTRVLINRIVETVKEAINDLEIGSLYWAEGKTEFSINRREFTREGIIIGHNPAGPTDHDVPVLHVVREDGSTKGVVHGYACHNNVLDLCLFSGDYAGFAQARLEEALPGTTALFVAGCGGDQNAKPRRTIELAKQFGGQLCETVLSVLNSDMAEVSGPISAVYEEIPLPLTDLPPRTSLEGELGGNDAFLQRKAKKLLDFLERKAEVLTAYPYPIQIWRFSKTLQIIALAGEAVVDYSLRLKEELGRDRQWILAYANDVMAYIPSQRILSEGGYESEMSMIYYGLRGTWSPQIEDTIIGAVHRLIDEAKTK